MNKNTARAVQGAVQFLFHTLIVLAFFFVPSIVEGLIFGLAA
ncbi:hypothetical protein OUO20_13650 [Arthrobacter sp. FX8]|nr:hypothetical protein [Arthrobacter sp. FX8]WAJ32203.1 hypothetical protein OUO20_13650 [Arthrobacter sp. FX8]